MNSSISVIEKHLSECTATDDSLARIQAVDVRSSCVVSAPAGSGKTELLSQRYLALLGVARNPEEILAITFTKKAASEMRDRILKALLAADQSLPFSGHQKITRELALCALKRSSELGWNLIENPSQLRIRTIDSFYASIAKRAPMASKMGGGMKVSNNIGECYQNAVLSLFEDLDDVSTWQPHMVNLLTALDNRLDIVQKMLVSLLEKREQWLPIVISAKNSAGLRKELEGDIASVVDHHREKCIDMLDAYGSEMFALVEFASRNAPVGSGHFGEHLATSTSFQDAVWQSIYTLFFTSSGDVRKSPTANIGFPAPSSVKDKGLKEEYKTAKDQFKIFTDALREDVDAVDAIKELYGLPAANYEDSDWIILEALLELLPILAGRLLLEFQSYGAVDHTAVSSAAICALGGRVDVPTDIALVLDRQLSHVLVDEFQDTNNVQMIGLNLLMEGWELGDGRSLFCVGDAMQSIYGFRGSNVGLFIDSAQYGIGDLELSHLQLTRNFRSESGLVQWFNDFFSTAFPTTNRSEVGAVAYCSAVSCLPHGRPDPVKINAFTADDGSAAKAEAYAIAHEIESILDRSEDETVAVLVRSRSHLVQIVASLKEAGVTYQAIDIDPLANTPVVADLRSLTLCLMDPTDRLSWLALLRSPLCGLDSGDMLISSEVLRDALPPSDSDHETLQNRMSPAGFTKIKSIIDTLALAKNHLCRKAVAETVEGCWLSLYGPAGYPGENTLSHSEQYFDMLSKIEEPFDLQCFQLELSKLYARPKSGANARVQLLTLHKSKGLEYDHVFIPCCERVSSSDDRQLLSWDYMNQNGVEKALIAPGDAINSDPGSIGLFLASRAKQRTQNESLRLLYVGCTRAKKSLHLSFTSYLADDELQKPRNKSFAGHVYAHAANLINHIHNGPVQVCLDWVVATSENIFPEITRIVNPSSPIEFCSGDLLAKFRGRIQENESSESLPSSWALQYGHHLGTVLHRIAARICQEGVDNWVDRDLGLYRDTWQSQLNQLGVPPYLLDNFSKRIETLIRRLVHNDDIHWVFNDSPDARSEARFHSSEGVHTKTHIIDRIIHQNGNTWLVDFKSDERERNESETVYHQRLIRKHKDQLNRYDQIYSEATGHSVKRAIYAFETATLIEC